MGIILSIIFLFLSSVFYLKEKSILDPLFVMPFLWGVFLFLYETLPHSLYPLKEQFLFAICLWVFSFFLTGALVRSHKTKIRKRFNRKILNVYFIIIVVLSPIVFYLTLKEAAGSGVGYFIIKLRSLNTGTDEDNKFTLGLLSYVFNLASATLLLCAVFKDKIKKWMFYIILIISIMLGILTLARTSLVFMLVGLFVIFYFQNKLKKKHYLYFLSIVSFFIIFMTFLRSFNADPSKNKTFVDIISVYLFGGMPAFDTVQFEDINQIGAYSFRFFYAVLNSLGYSYEVKDTILGYTYIPATTNVYTVMFPFYKDFGFAGVGIFGAVYGFIFRYVYLKAKKSSSIYLVIYAFIFPMFLLQFFGEYLFMNLSSVLQIVIISYIPIYFRLK